MVVIGRYSFFFGGLMIDVVSICFKDDLAPNGQRVFVVFSWGFWQQLRLGGSPLRVATVDTHEMCVCRFQLLLYLFVFNTMMFG